MQERAHRLTRARIKGRGKADFQFWRANEAATVRHPAVAVQRRMVRIQTLKAASGVAWRGRFFVSQTQNIG